MTKSLRQSLDGQLKQLARDQWSRQSIRMMLRFAWLGLSVCSVVLGLHLLFGWPLRFDLLLLVLLAALVLSGLWLLRPRMSAHQAARRLDQRFRLNDQLSTALEVSAQGAPEGVALHLLDQSRHTMHRVQRYVTARQRFPWSEVLTVASLLLVVLGLLLFLGLDPLALRPATEPLPSLVDPENPVEEFPPEPFTPPQSEQPAAPDPSGQAEGAQGNENQAAAMSALADALRDQSVTRPAADALDRGDTDQAAEALRSLADQADQLSPTTRGDLAEALREAAEQIGADNPESLLDDQLRRNAAQLEQGSQGAAEALEELAAMAEQLGAQEAAPQEGQAGQDQSQPGQDQGQGPGSGAGNSPLSGDQREQAQSTERLGVEGVPLELDSEGAGNLPGEGTPDETTSTGAGVQGFEANPGVPDSSRVQAGEDPLRIPADLRDVVQEYFSPEN